ncbi:hypothetical protein BD410DRAFT_845971 [Rickenella mellea]|uniref:Uncharacterized protein n=1 Tax=Rickenella mellea TaxID=50990 RepID=A0A4Y7PHP5_9AGAM|nr:hypothetical protein BD410DRAFT_845971 [Rickenella mellea]
MTGSKPKKPASSVKVFRRRSNQPSLLATDTSISRHVRLNRVKKRVQKRVSNVETEPIAVEVLNPEIGPPDGEEFWVDDMEPINVNVPKARKRTDPLLGWTILRDEFLDEMIRHDGLGSETLPLKCAKCGNAAAYRCIDCAVHAVNLRGAVATRLRNLPLPHSVAPALLLHPPRPPLPPLLPFAGLPDQLHDLQDCPSKPYQAHPRARTLWMSRDSGSRTCCATAPIAPPAVPAASALRWRSGSVAGPARLSYLAISSTPTGQDLLDVPRFRFAFAPPSLQHAPIHPPATPVTR